MEEIDKKEFEDAKKIDSLYILELVKTTPNDGELGAAVRHYVLFMRKD